MRRQMRALTWRVHEGLVLLGRDIRVCVHRVAGVILHAQLAPRGVVPDGRDVGRFHGGHRHADSLSCRPRIPKVGGFRSWTISPSLNGSDLIPSCTLQTLAKSTSASVVMVLRTMVSIMLPPSLHPLR